MQTWSTCKINWISFTMISTSTCVMTTYVVRRRTISSTIFLVIWMSLSMIDELRQQDYYEIAIKTNMIKVIELKMFFETIELLVTIKHSRDNSINMLVIDSVHFKATSIKIINLAIRAILTILINIHSLVRAINRKSSKIRLIEAINKIIQVDNRSMTIKIKTTQIHTQTLEQHCRHRELNFKSSRVSQTSSSRIRVIHRDNSLDLSIMIVMIIIAIVDLSEHIKSTWSRTLMKTTSRVTESQSTRNNRHIDWRITIMMMIIIKTSSTSSI